MEYDCHDRDYLNMAVAKPDGTKNIDSVKSAFISRTQISQGCFAMGRSDEMVWA